MALATAGAAAAALAVIVLVNTLAPATSSSGVGAVGQSAAFTTTRLGSTHLLSLETFRGKPVVVTFLASWCGPCRTELPVVEQAAQQARGKVAFLGIDVSDNPSAAQSLLMRSGITFPVGTDPSRHISADIFNLYGMPSTVFVDAGGRVVGEITGPVTPSGLTRWLQRLSGI